MPAAFSRLDDEEAALTNTRSSNLPTSLGQHEDQQQLHAVPPGDTSSAVSNGGDPSPLSLSLDGSSPGSDGSDDSDDGSWSTWSPLRRVASPVVVRTHSSQTNGICLCVDPRLWSYAMVVAGIAVMALAVLDVYFVYRQYADGERFIWSTLMWTSVGFSLGLFVCCGLCVATHGGTGMISLVLRDKGLVDDERTRR